MLSGEDLDNTMNPDTGNAGNPGIYEGLPIPPGMDIPQELSGLAAAPEYYDTTTLEGNTPEQSGFGKRHTAEIFGDTEDDFTRALGLIRDSLGIDPGANVLYPGSGTHAGVAHVFGKDRTIHIDPDQTAIAELTEHGYYAVAQGIEDYTPNEPADVMILLNTYGRITPEDQAQLRRLVKSGGVIVANNHTRWAHDLVALDNAVELQGAIFPSYHNQDARYASASEIPKDATDIPITYYKFGGQDGMTPGTPEDHDFADEEPKYPDALFVFRVK